MSTSHKRRLRLGLFYRYFFSYLSIVALALGIISFIILGVFMRDFREKAKANNTDKLQQLKQVTDLQLFQLEHTLVTQIALDPALTPLHLGSETEGGYSVTRILNAYRTRDPAVFDVAIHYGGDPVVYSGDGPYRLSDFFSRHFVYTGLRPKALVQTAAHDSQATLLGDHLVGVDNGLHIHLLTYFYPVPISSRDTLTIMIFIDSREFGMTMDRFVATSPGYLMLLTSQGTPIYEAAAASEPKLGKESLGRIGGAASAAKVADQPVLRSLRLGGIAYTATLIRSSLGGLVYCLLIPEREYTRDIRTVSTTFVATIAGIFLLGLLLALLFSQRSYAPLARLRGKLALPASRAGNVFSHADEIESIGTGLDRILAQNEELTSRIRQDRGFTREQLLLPLLTGRMRSARDISEQLEGTGLDLGPGPYVVLCLLREESARERDSGADQLVSLIEQRASALGHGVAAVMADGHIALIFGVDRGEPEFAVDELIRNIRHDTATGRRRPLTIAVGEPSQDLEGVSHSYDTARTAALHRFRLGRYGVIYHRDIAPNAEIPTYIVLRNQGDIERLIRQGDLEELRSACNGVFKEITDRHFPIDVSMYLANSLLGAILRVVEDLNVPIGGFLKSLNAERILLVGQFETIDDFKSYVLRLSSYVCDYINDRKHTKNPTLREGIVEYLERSFTDPQLSLKHIAYTFDRSPSYVSRFFRDQTGETIMAWVDRKRMELCKTLLTTTSVGLDEILARAGYMDKTNFIRKFRQSTGVTPMQFRAQHRHSTVESGSQGADAGLIPIGQGRRL